jgi:hypothetical protein
MSEAPRLSCRRRGALATSVPLEDRDGRAVGALAFGDAAAAPFSVGGRDFRIERIGTGRWRCREADGAELATAWRRQRQPLVIDLTLGGEAGWCLRSAGRAGWLGSRVELRHRDAMAGAVVRRTGLRANALEADAEPTVPDPFLAFAAWLVGIHWVGMTRATVAAGA